MNQRLKNKFDYEPNGRRPWLLICAGFLAIAAAGGAGAIFVQRISAAPMAPVLDRSERPLRHRDRHLDESPSAPQAKSPELERRTETVRLAVARAQRDVRTPNDLAKFLDEQEQVARENHKVSAFEIEPAVAAIRRLYSGSPQLAAEAIGKFSNRMAKLASELAVNTGGADDGSVIPPSIKGNSTL